MYIHTHMYIHTCTHVHTYMHTHVHTHTHTECLPTPTHKNASIASDQLLHLVQQFHGKDTLVFVLLGGEDRGGGEEALHGPQLD